MDHPPVGPPQDKDYITSSRRGDKMLGVFWGVGWWVGGAILVVMTQSPITVLAVLGALVWQLIHMGRNPARRPLLVAMALTLGLFPVVLFLGVIGMCTAGGFKLG